MGQAFVANAQAPEGIVQPSEGPLDHPALGDQRAVDQVGTPAPAAASEEGTLWDVRANLALVEDRAEGAAVVALIGDEAPRTMAPSDVQPLQGGYRSAQIVVGGGHERQGQGHALGIHDQRALRPVETGLARGADRSAPFFAGTRLASSMVCSRRSMSWRLSMTRSAPQRRIHVPCCIH